MWQYVYMSPDMEKDLIAAELAEGKWKSKVTLGKKTKQPKMVILRDQNDRMVAKLGTMKLYRLHVVNGRYKYYEDQFVLKIPGKGNFTGADLPRLVKWIEENYQLVKGYEPPAE